MIETFLEENIIDQTIGTINISLFDDESFLKL